jgi:hypothetical protein
MCTSRNELIMGNELIFIKPVDSGQCGPYKESVNCFLVSLIIGSNKKIRVVVTISNNEPLYLLKDLEVEVNLKATSRIATVLDQF